ncbi:exocyst complex component 5 [Rhipicephalus sanguineus]|uniref:exocyst complex component 5 n=1 Tax=Rhipicephalus sanguineus TaxID=34632 RepID=UPI0020C20E2C|nr:exocyst complex component 5 [Rhipicephalus sanguineus]
MSHFLPELEQESFSPEDFVERLAWRSLGGNMDPETFDPSVLQEAFKQGIRDLQVLFEMTQKKCERLEMICREEEARHCHKVAELQDKNKSSYATYKELDSQIGYVAMKVVHLGDLLESVNTPRSRAVEAQKLMKHFAEFLRPEHGSHTGIFHDPAKLHEAADIIQKLHLIAQELPYGKFEKARFKIAQKYNEIEKALIAEFVRAHHEGDKETMRQVAAVLSHFRGYANCIDTFIDESQMGAFMKKDMFSNIVPLCERSEQVIEEVFTNPEQVMCKFVSNIYNGKLQEYIQSNLSDRSDPEKYLRTLYELYSKTMQLSSNLSKFKMGNDPAFLKKLTRQIFSKHLDPYLSIEMQYLRDKCCTVLNRYYESKNHHKRQFQFGGIHDLRRDLQAKLGARSNINIAPTVENFGGETFLSEEVAINLLQESKLAFQRCQLVCHLCTACAHSFSVDFFSMITLWGHARTSYFIYVKHLSTPEHGVCLQKKRELTEQMEIKMDTGLDRSLAAIIGWVHCILQTEQKKTDFKPEVEDVIETTKVAQKVVKYVTKCIEKLRDSLDGTNVDAVLLELGVRFHRTIYEHIQTFQYSTVGGMILICDHNEYRKCAKLFKIPALDKMFDVLHALCNLLVVAPENLKDVCRDDQLASLERGVLVNFVQLRTDCKVHKLVNQFK